MKKLALLSILLLAPWGVQAADLPVSMNGKIVTPFRSVTFDLQNPTGETPNTVVVNLRGQRIGTLQNVAANRYAWDGRDSEGRRVESGMYLIQIAQGPSRWHGVVAVAK